MSILCVMQARMGSKRLPGKVMFDMSGKTVIEHVVNRVRSSKLIDHYIVATSIDQNNLPLIEHCANKGFSVFIGSENDVLDRYFQAARLFEPKHIVRITADCPLHDAQIIDKVIELHLNSHSDYTSNVYPPTFPDGLDVEVFTFESLRNAWENAKLKSEREHVTSYISESGLFSCTNYFNDDDISNKRWTLDELADYKFIKIIFENLYDLNPLFGMKDIINYLQDNPEVENINSHLVRNEGYTK